MSNVRNWPGYLAEVRRPMHAAVVYQFRQYASCLRRPPSEAEKQHATLHLCLQPKPSARHFLLSGETRDTVSLGLTQISEPGQDSGRPISHNISTGVYERAESRRLCWE